MGTWGPAICGHANDEVNEALVECLKKGTSFGAPSANENVLAKMVIDAVPSVEMVRFTNSGTEACAGRGGGDGEPHRPRLREYFGALSPEEWKST